MSILKDDDDQHEIQLAGLDNTVDNKKQTINNSDQSQTRKQDVENQNGKDDLHTISLHNSDDQIPHVQHQEEGGEKKKQKNKENELTQQEKDDKRFFLVSAFSAFMYLVTAVGMTIFNKIILNSFDYKNPNVLILWQNFITVVLMLAKRELGYSKFTFKFEVAKKWILANLLFVFMLSTSGFALQYLSVPMVAVFKNFSVTSIAIGDKYFFGAVLSQKVQLTLALMIGGSILSGITDLAFSAPGYFWMTLHVTSQCAYVLYIKQMKKEIKLSEDEMVYYNNILSLPIFIVIAFLNGEWGDALTNPVWGNTNFIIIWFISGAIGMLISLFSFMCMSYSGPTTYAIVGSLNKVPLTLLGFVLFDTPVNFQNGVSVTVGIIAGLIYSKAKYDESQKSGQVMGKH